MLAQSINKEASTQREAQLSVLGLKELQQSKCLADSTWNKGVALVNLETLAVPTPSTIKIQAPLDQEGQLSRTINASFHHLVSMVLSNVRTFPVFVSQAHSTFAQRETCMRTRTVESALDQTLIEMVQAKERCLSLEPIITSHHWSTETSRCQPPQKRWEWGTNTQANTSREIWQLRSRDKI